MHMKDDLQNSIRNSWKSIAVAWPLQNFVSSNPLRGFESIPFEQALKEAYVQFEQKDIPLPFEEINRLSIKWVQQFFDEKQTAVAMPGKQRGLYAAWSALAVYDHLLHKNNQKHLAWLQSLPRASEDVIAACLDRLAIEPHNWQQFMTIILTTLPGWAAYVSYAQYWSDHKQQYQNVSQDYLAMRLVITCVVWPEAKELVHRYEEQENLVNISERLNTILSNERLYQQSLQKKLLQQKNSVQGVESQRHYDAQFIFCIDTRSEPFRKKLESVGPYETYGYAGFFSAPVRIKNISNHVYSSCPVLLQPKHTVQEQVICYDGQCKVDQRGNEILRLLKQFYQSMKYTFAVPFVLVEILGVFSGLWMLLSTMFPVLADTLYQRCIFFVRPPLQLKPDLKDISLRDQCLYVYTTLKTIGLTSNFASLIIITGHGSSTRNNSFATALDCGACGGRKGGSNARIFAAMANNKEVRQYLLDKDIVIPDTTVFVGAEHDTTTDIVALYDYNITDTHQEQVALLKQVLASVGKQNAADRIQQFDKQWSLGDKVKDHSVDWAQVRPEWGLAQNASFIIGPRDFTKNIDLQGRSFLHSYDYEQDTDGALLAAILTAPVIVAQWISMQYLFSSMNNVAYGAGSKVTLNFTGKFGVMQGNASDLMHGLSLQSLYKTDTELYHSMQRLLVIVYAPRDRVAAIIEQQEMFVTLLNNGWLFLECYDPATRMIYRYDKEKQWDVVTI